MDQTPEQPEDTRFAPAGATPQPHLPRPESATEVPEGIQVAKRIDASDVDADTTNPPELVQPLVVDKRTGFAYRPPTAGVRTPWN